MARRAGVQRMCSACATVHVQSMLDDPDLAEALPQTVHQRQRDGSFANMLTYGSHEERPRHRACRDNEVDGTLFAKT